MAKGMTFKPRSTRTARNVWINPVRTKEVKNKDKAPKQMADKATTMLPAKTSKRDNAKKAAKPMKPVRNGSADGWSKY